MGRPHAFPLGPAGEFTMQRRGQQTLNAAHSNGALDADMIKRAEEAVSGLSDEYREWARGDIAHLREWLSKIETKTEEAAPCFVKMRAIAHDMRGQGSTFGYPLMTRIAKSLSQIIKEVGESANDLSIVGAHIDAMAAVIENDVTDARSAQAHDIIRSLESATGQTIN